MLNELANEIHQNARAHGWHDEERSFGDIIALCHSELSEALEEYRNASPDFYCEDAPTCTNPDDCIECFRDGIIRKPEGVAIELSDCIIRILDECGHMGNDIDRECDLNRAKNEGFTLPELISECHYLLSMAYKYDPSHLAECINLIRSWCEDNGIDIDEAIRIKHEYNRTRSWKHGGKVI